MTKQDRRFLYRAFVGTLTGIVLTLFGTITMAPASAADVPLWYDNFEWEDIGDPAELWSNYQQFPWGGGHMEVAAGSSPGAKPGVGGNWPADWPEGSGIPYWPAGSTGDDQVYEIQGAPNLGGAWGFRTYGASPGDFSQIAVTGDYASLSWKLKIQEITDNSDFRMSVYNQAGGDFATYLRVNSNGIGYYDGSHHTLQSLDWDNWYQFTQYFNFNDTENPNGATSLAVLDLDDVGATPNLYSGLGHPAWAPNPENFGRFQFRNIETATAISIDMQLDDVVVMELDEFPDQGLAGDFDEDGDVDGADFLMWQRDTGVGSLTDWENNYGTSAAVAAPVTSAVPEPSTLLLIGMGLVSLAYRRRIGR